MSVKKKVKNPRAPYGTCADGSPRAKPGRRPAGRAGRRLVMKSLRVDAAEWEAWRKQSAAAGMRHSEWIRKLINAAIGYEG